MFSFLLIKDLKCCLINVLSLLFFEKLQTKNFDLRKLKFEKSLIAITYTELVIKSSKEQRHDTNQGFKQSLRQW